MSHATYICQSVLMCHAPIVLPEVGGARGSDCIASTQGMRQAADSLVGAAPDVIVVISPHTPRHRQAFGLMEGEMIQGDFSNFGAPQVQIRLPSSSSARSAIMEAAQKSHEVSILPTPSQNIDHGAAVPLSFVQEAGFSGSILLFSLPWGCTHAQCQALGEIINQAAGTSGQRWAILASGDMSHRLIPGAPSGFHPKARDFDAFFTEHIAAGDYHGALAVDPELRQLAAEDVVDTVEIAAAAGNFSASGHRLISYEGPFGVGYLIAILFDNAGPASLP